MIQSTHSTHSKTVRNKNSVVAHGCCFDSRTCSAHHSAQDIIDRYSITATAVTNRTDAGREDEPAELPPDAGVVPDHVANVVIKPIHT